MIEQLHDIYIPTLLDFKNLFTFDNFRFTEAEGFLSSKKRHVLGLKLEKKSKIPFHLSTTPILAKTGWRMRGMKILAHFNSSLLAGSLRLLLYCRRKRRFYGK